MHKIGERIRQAMDAQRWISKDLRLMRWTAGRLAELLGVSPNTAQKWVNSESVPPTHRLDQIGGLLGVRTEWLLRGGRESRVRADHPMKDVIVSPPLHQVTGPISTGWRPPSLMSELHMYRTFWRGFEDRESASIRPKKAGWWWDAINPTARVVFADDLAQWLGRFPIQDHTQRGRVAADRLLGFVENAYDIDKGMRRLTKDYVGRAWTDRLIGVIHNGVRATSKKTP